MWDFFYWLWSLVQNTDFLGTVVGGVFGAAIASFIAISAAKNVEQNNAIDNLKIKKNKKKGVRLHNKTNVRLNNIVIFYPIDRSSLLRKKRIKLIKPYSASPFLMGFNERYLGNKYLLDNIQIYKSYLPFFLDFALFTYPLDNLHTFFKNRKKQKNGKRLLTFFKKNFRLLAIYFSLVRLALNVLINTLQRKYRNDFINHFDISLISDKTVKRLSISIFSTNWKKRKIVYNKIFELKKKTYFYNHNYNYLMLINILLSVFSKSNAKFIKGSSNNNRNNEIGVEVHFKGAFKGRIKIKNIIKSIINPYSEIEKFIPEFAKSSKENIFFNTNFHFNHEKISFRVNKSKKSGNYLFIRFKELQRGLRTDELRSVSITNKVKVFNNANWTLFTWNRRGTVVDVDSSIILFMLNNCYGSSSLGFFRKFEGAILINNNTCELVILVNNKRYCFELQKADLEDIKNILKEVQTKRGLNKIFRLNQASDTDNKLEFFIKNPRAISM